jgi:hypothetical protein
MVSVDLVQSLVFELQERRLTCWPWQQHCKTLLVTECLSYLSIDSMWGISQGYTSEEHRAWCLSWFCPPATPCRKA